jgi:hypothetical protein
MVKRRELWTIKKLFKPTLTRKKRRFDVGNPDSSVSSINALGVIATYVDLPREK